MPHKRPEFLDFEESVTLDAANLRTTHQGRPHRHPSSYSVPARQPS